MKPKKPQQPQTQKKPKKEMNPIDGAKIKLMNQLMNIRG